MGSLDVLSTRIGTINGPRVGRRGNVLECASALALLWMRPDRTGPRAESMVQGKPRFALAHASGP